MSADNVVKLVHITKAFSEGRHNRLVLNTLSCEFTKGEFVVLLGKSGSGKSTLLNLIRGIEEPTDGQIFVENVELTRLSQREKTLFRRDHIGFVFQFFNLIPTLTVMENITLPQELAGQNGRSVTNSAAGLLEQVGLADRHETFPDKLSGGEQQRVAIARALAHDPMLVLADEPTGNLDEDTGERVLNMLLDLTKNRGKTLIMATHNPDIAHLADRVYRVQDGKLTDITAELHYKPNGVPSAELVQG